MRDGKDAYGIPEPVGGGGKTHTAGADRQRENLANNDPRSWAPCAREEEDEDGNEGDLSVDRRDVVGSAVAGSVQVGFVEAGGDTDDCHEELTDQHAKGTPEEKRTTAELLNSVEGDRC